MAAPIHNILFDVKMSTENDRTPSPIYERQSICLLCSYSFIHTEITSTGEKKEVKHFKFKLRLTKERIKNVKRILPSFAIPGDDINNGICLKCNKVVERIIHMEGEITKLKNGLKESCKVALAKAREMLAEKKLKSPCSTVTLKQPKASKIIVKPATRPASNYVQQFVAIAPKPADIPKPDSARPVIIPWFGKNGMFNDEIDFRGNLEEDIIMLS